MEGVNRLSLLWVVPFGLLFLITACADRAAETAIPPQDPQLVETGAGLYAAHCAECHGDDLGGTERGPSQLSEVYDPRHHPDEAYQLAVLRGSPAHHWNFGAMPAIPGLSREEVEAIVAFIRERQRVEGFEPYPP